jgi:hypothetical protein
VIIKGLLRGKLSPKTALFGHRLPKKDLDAVRAIYEKVEGRERRYELNLYVTGSDEDTEAPQVKGEQNATGEPNATGEQVPSAPAGAEGSTSA